MNLQLDLKTLHEWPLPVKVFVLVVIFLGVIGLGYYADTSKQSERLERAEREIATLQTTLQVKENQLKNLSQNKVVLEKLKQKLLEVQKQLPSTQEIPALVDAIAKAAQKTGLVVQTIKPLKPVALESYERLPIEMQIKGKYPDIVAFLKTISSLERIVEVGNFTLVPEDEKQPEELVMNLTLNTFIFLPQTYSQSAHTPQ